MYICSGLTSGEVRVVGVSYYVRIRPYVIPSPRGRCDEPARPFTTSQAHTGRTCIVQQNVWRCTSESHRKLQFTAKEFKFDTRYILDGIRTSNGCRVMHVRTRFMENQKKKKHFVHGRVILWLFGQSGTRPTRHLSIY